MALRAPYAEDGKPNNNQLAPQKLTLTLAPIAESAHSSPRGC